MPISFGTPGSAKCPEMGLGSFGILAQLTREAPIRPSEDITSRFQVTAWGMGAEAEVLCLQ